MKKTHKAFTLIELLVVISIIALLMSILLPALGKARESAKSLICQTRLRSLQMAMIFYWDNTKGKFFPYEFHSLYIDFIASYHEDLDEIRYCPKTKLRSESDVHWGMTDKADRKTTWVWAPSVRQLEGLDIEQGAYGFNGWLYGDPQAAAWVFQSDNQQMIPHFFNKLNNVDSPVETPCFGDAAWPDAWPLATSPPAGSPDGAASFGSNGMCRFNLDRHNNRKTNLSFVDGHVDSVPAEKLWQLKWYKHYVPDYDYIGTLDLPY